MALNDLGQRNLVEVGNNVSVSGKVDGSDNSIVIEDSIHPSSLKINVNGDGNSIFIKNPLLIKGLSISVGNHVKAHNTSLYIGKNLSIEQNGSILLFNSGNTCRIGSDCLLSIDLTIRCGESPHLIFDEETGKYLDVSDGVFIGNHVWIGERVYITKKASIPADCIVAACSVVTRRFSDEKAVIAGNPAKVVRKNIQWVKNYSHLEPGSKFQESYKNYNAEFPRR